MVICDNHIWWSHIIIIYDENIWSSYMMVICDSRIRWSSMMIIYDDHTWWSFMMIIYGDHMWWSCTSTSQVLKRLLNYSYDNMCMWLLVIMCKIGCLVGSHKRIDCRSDCVLGGVCDCVYEFVFMLCFWLSITNAVFVCLWRAKETAFHEHQIGDEARCFSACRVDGAWGP